MNEFLFKVFVVFLTTQTNLARAPWAKWLGHCWGETTQHIVYYFVTGKHMCCPWREVPPVACGHAPTCDEYYYQALDLEVAMEAAFKSGALEEYTYDSLMAALSDQYLVLKCAKFWLDKQGTIAGFPAMAALNEFLEDNNMILRDNGGLMSGAPQHQYAKKTLVFSSDKAFEEEAKLWLKIHSAQLRGFNNS